MVNEVELKYYLKLPLIFSSIFVKDINKKMMFLNFLISLAQYAGLQADLDDFDTSDNGSHFVIQDGGHI